MNDNISDRFNEAKPLTTASPMEVAVADNHIIALTVTNPNTEFTSGIPTFKRTLTNIGNGYGVQSGVFTCPIAGLYMFVYTIGSFNSADIYCYIYHNNKQLVIARTGSLSYSTSTSSVFLMLARDDKVKLSTCNWNGNGNVYNSNGATTFSGVLIRQKP